MSRTVDSDKLWEEAQKKTFRGWVNMHLDTKGLRVAELTTDLADGVKLIALLEVLNNKPIEGRYYKNPKSRPYRIDNVNFALNFIRTELGVKLIGCSAEDIVDGNIKMVLGLLWRLIQKFQMGTDNSRKELLLWCQESVAPYNLTVENLQTSFRDGLVFCALLHKFDSSLLNFESLTKEDALGNLTRAFDLAEEHLSIAKLLEAKDVQEGVLDERSVMTYLSMWHRAFQEKFGKKSATGAADSSAKPESSPASASTSSAASSTTTVAAAVVSPTVSDSNAEEFRKQAEQAKKELADAQTELEKLRKENQQLREDLAKLQSELNALKESAAAKPSEEPSKPEEPKVEETPKVEEPVAVAAPAVVAVAAAPAEPVVVNLSEEEKKKFEQQIEESKNKIKELENQIEQANKSNEQAQKELEETKEDFTNLQKKYKKDVEKEAKRQKKKLEKALKDKDKEAEELKTQLDAEISKRDAEIKSLKSKLKKAKKDVAEGQQAQAQSAMDKDVDEVKKEVEELLQLSHMFESEESTASRKDFQPKSSEATEDK